MSDKVINLFGDQLHDDTPEQFLEKVRGVDFDSVIVIGQEQDGSLWFGGNSGDLQHALWLCMRGIWYIQKETAAIVS